MFIMLFFETNLAFSQSYLPPNSATTYMRMDPLALTQPSFFVQDYTKNHLIIRNVTDDGYLQCMAGLTYINNMQMWCIRLIEIDDDLNVRWTKDINLEESTQVPISTTPFAICKSFDNNEYIITGIVDNRIDTSFKINHKDSLTQRAFFLSLDVLGTVQLSKISVPILPNDFFRFAPMSIAPRHNNQGYIAVGFVHTDFYYAQGTNLGYISIMDNNFNETDGKVVASWYTLSLHPTGNETQGFDALLKVKPIPNTDDYIICGSMTEELFKKGKNSGIFYTNLWDNFPTFSGAAGSTQGYISRINDNLSIMPMWELTTAKSSNRHCNIIDFVIDDENEKRLYAVGNSIINEPHTLKSYGLIFEIDYQTGSVIDGGDLTISINTHTSFWTNIFSDVNHVYLCGFNKDITPPSGFNMLNPKVTSFLKSNLTVSNFSYYIDAENQNFDFGTNAYQGYANLFYPPQSNFPTNFQLKLFDTTYVRNNFHPDENKPYVFNSLNYQQSSPTSYVPNAWLYDTERGFTCITLRDWQNLNFFNGPIPIPFSFPYPTVWANTITEQCHEITYEFFYDVIGHPMENVNTLFGQVTINNNTIRGTNINNYDYRQGYDCETPPPVLTENTHMTKSNTNQFKIIKDINESNIWKIVPVTLESSQILLTKFSVLDLSGKLLYESNIESNSNFSLPVSRKGLFLLHIYYSNGKIETHKVLNY